MNGRLCQIISIKSSVFVASCFPKYCNPQSFSELLVRPDFTSREGGRGWQIITYELSRPSVKNSLLLFHYRLGTGNGRFQVFVYYLICSMPVQDSASVFNLERVIDSLLKPHDAIFASPWVILTRYNNCIKL